MQRLRLGRRHSMLRQLVICAAVAVTASACSPWTMAGFNAERTHDNTAESTLTTSNVGQLFPRSVISVGNVQTSTHLSPAITNGFMYVAGQQGGLIVYDANGKVGCSFVPSDCEPLWVGHVPATAQRSSPSVVNGTAYLGGTDGRVYAFDANGKTNCTDKLCQAVRTYAAGGPVSSSPAIVDGVLYVTAGAAGRTLYAFDANGKTNCSGTPISCTALWSASLGGVGSDATVAAGRVYVGAADGRAYAFDAAGTTNCSGSPRVCSPLWTAKLSGTTDSVSTLAYANGVLYATSTDGRLYALDATGAGCSGTPTTCVALWRSTVSTRVTAPAVANGIVYSDTPAGVEAFDAAGHTHCAGGPKTCTPLWRAVGTIAETPAIANGVLYVGEHAGTLQAFDAAGTTNCSGTPRTCQPLLSLPVGSISSAPVVANGAVTVRADLQTSSHYQFIDTFAIVGPTIFAYSPDSNGTVLVEGDQFPSSSNGVVAVTDEDQSNEVATGNFTTGAEGSIISAVVTLPVWQCGDHIRATATVGTVTASYRTVLGCMTASS